MFQYIKNYILFIKIANLQMMINYDIYFLKL